MKKRLIKAFLAFAWVPLLTSCLRVLEPLDAIRIARSWTVEAAKNAGYAKLVVTYEEPKAEKRVETYVGEELSKAIESNLQFAQSVVESYYFLTTVPNSSYEIVFAEEDGNLRAISRTGDGRADCKMNALGLFLEWKNSSYAQGLLSHVTYEWIV